MNESEIINKLDSTKIKRSLIETSEYPNFYKDHDFYLLHANAQLINVPKWEKQLEQYLTEKGTPKDQIHIPHLKNLFADYRSWWKDSGLPKNPEDSKKAVLFAHSSGAEFALAYAQYHEVFGLVLFGAYDSANIGGDIIGSLMSPIEKASGMFTKSNPDKKGILHRIKREFNWDNIVKNCVFIVIVHASGDTHIVPEIASENVYNMLINASRKLPDAKTGEEGVKILYITVEGKGHIPEVRQFAQIMSRILP